MLYSTGALESIYVDRRGTPRGITYSHITTATEEQKNGTAKLAGRGLFGCHQHE